MTSYIQWYNANEGRAYPFKESASLLALGGNQLPNSLIVDMNIMVPDAYAAGLYCPFIKVTPKIISLGVASDAAGLFTATFNVANIQPYMANQMTALLPDISGWVVFGSYVAKQPEFYRFARYQDSEIDDKVTHIIEVPPVTKIMKLGSSQSRYVSKIVRLASGAGVRIYNHETSPNIIVVDVDNPEIFVGPCNPRIDLTADRTTLHSINGIKPDENGIITIRFDG